MRGRTPRVARGYFNYGHIRELRKGAGAGRNEYVDPDEFTDVIGRNFKRPREGLGVDGSPTAR
jgi:hypothetical protein